MSHEFSEADIPQLPTRIPSRSVLVCQNRTCRKQGAVAVLQAFLAQPIAGTIVTGVGCLGQCGNGPMVLVLPDNVWYSQVNVEDVAAVIEHLS